MSWPVWPPFWGHLFNRKEQTLRGCLGKGAMKKKIVIIGGVAGGASCAARARRISEDAEIIMLEKGPYVSFANCGLPYYVGNIIKKEKSLLVATPELFRKRFNIDVRVLSRVRKIIRGEKCVEVISLPDNRVYRETYDDLVIATGSQPIVPAVSGIDIPGIFSLWTIPDSRDILGWIETGSVRSAVIVGAGFIGLEMAENLSARGIAVTIIEMQPQVMPVMDAEMAYFIHEHLMEKKIRVILSCAVQGFEKDEAAIRVRTGRGEDIRTDMVLLSVGVRPQGELAVAAGLKTGERGGICVDQTMRTSDSSIWAVGDVVEVTDYVSGLAGMVPLAGPANRQGRIAADNIAGGRKREFRGVQATSVCGVLGLTVATTGMTEKALARMAHNGHPIPYEKVYLHPDNHADYYPDAEMITLKLLFSRENGKILGAQAVGKAGVAKRIDVISMAIQMRATVFDLEEAELCYAPQYGSAKDPVNLAGMIAANVLRGDLVQAHWPGVAGGGGLILDVRTVNEYNKGHIPGAVNIPIDDLRKRLSEIPQNSDVLAYCFVGQRSYIATRIMCQRGFNTRNISGGFRMSRAFAADGDVDRKNR